MTTLFHYCSNQNFLSIVEGKSIRLSSLTLSNDIKEGKLVTEYIDGLVDSDSQSTRANLKLREATKWMEQNIEGFGFCLSREGDILSQFLNYADKAKGVSLGFSKAYLEELTAVLKLEIATKTCLDEVIYDKESQLNLVRQIYGELKSHTSRGAFQHFEKDKRLKSKDFRATLSGTEIYKDLFLLKSDSFKAEVEWRLLAYFHKVEDVDYSFHAQDKLIKPYIRLELKALDHKCIEKLILGSRNGTPIEVMEKILHVNGFENVEVIRSTAPYQ